MVIMPTFAKFGLQKVVQDLIDAFASHCYCLQTFPSFSCCQVMRDGFHWILLHPLVVIFCLAPVQFAALLLWLPQWKWCSYCSILVIVICWSCCSVSPLGSCTITFREHPIDGVAQGAGSWSHCNGCSVHRWSCYVLLLHCYTVWRGIVCSMHYGKRAVHQLCHCLPSKNAVCAHGLPLWRLFLWSQRCHLGYKVMPQS